MTNPRFEIIETLSGEKSLKDMFFLERLHPAGPMYESHQVYIAQSKLKEKLSAAYSKDPLVLYDVGLGAASNSIAAFLAAHEVCGRKLKIISFESHMEVLQFALDNRDSFPHIKKQENVLSALLKNHFYEDAYVQWQVLEGDFLKYIHTPLPAPEIIFHDMYSPMKNPKLWGFEVFKRYFELTKNNLDKKECFFVTYSQATSIRASLLAVGFYVGHGIGLGMKRESTVASTALLELENPLETHWPSKWKNSSHGIPLDLNPDDLEKFGEKIINHPQFQLALT